jgi:hypothetical protein
VTSACALHGVFPVKHALLTALSLQSVGWVEADGDKDTIASNATELLLSKAPLLKEYYNIVIEERTTTNTSTRRTPCSDDGMKDETYSTNEEEEVVEEEDHDDRRMSKEVVLTQIPVLLEGHLPDPSSLPCLLLRLASEVNWNHEQECFEGIAMELANAYCELPEVDEVEANEVEVEAAGGDEKKNKLSLLLDEELSENNIKEETLSPFKLNPKTATLVQQVLFPAFRSCLIPPKDMASDCTVMQVACLEKLYKVFERC